MCIRDSAITVTRKNAYADIVRLIRLLNCFVSPFAADSAYRGYTTVSYTHLDAQEKIDNDVYYAKNISFALDVKIILKTIKTVLYRENVNVTRE